MEWLRGDTVGHGSFGTVSLAIPTNQNHQIPSLMAVKSCGVSHSASLMNEKSILDELRDCPHIIRCFGDSLSSENGEKLYNLLLEYASGGNLADKIKNSSNRGLLESDTRRYTKSILRALQFIHKNGYVHCDIKLHNVLLFSSKNNGDYTIKIADFGLAKKAGVEEELGIGYELRGTPLYMSPEMVAAGKQESPSDIWALGCAVAEMLTGATVWTCRKDTNIGELFMRIGIGEEIPEIPGKLSEEGKDFLGKCFFKDPQQRWTAEMLLNHPFISDHDDDSDTVLLKDAQEVHSSSPRRPFDFPDSASVQSSLTCSITSLSSPKYMPENDSWFEGELNSSSGSPFSSPEERLRRLVMDQRPDWSVSENWVTVR